MKTSNNHKKSKVNYSLALVIALGLLVQVANADFTFGKPNNLGPVINSSATDDAPFISADGLSLYMFSNRPGGSGDWDLWLATRGTIDAEWDAPVNLGQTINSTAQEAGPCVSANGLELYYMSKRGGIYDIWIATRATVSDSWGAPVNLGQTVNSSAIDAGPHLSPDGLSLFFHSTRPGGYGGFDIWVTTRASIGEPWGEPINLGPTINGSGNEQGPNISADELMFIFGSDRPGGFGERDLYLTTRANKNEPWQEPVNLGRTVNTAAHEYLPFISPDGSTLYFSSNRPGGIGDYDLWQAPIQTIVDLNGDGIVDAADMCIIVDNWETDNSLYDIGPMPWGDGIVDVQDMIVLSGHLFEEVHDPTLIAHWALDETEGMFAADSVGDNDAIVVGGAVWQSNAGQVNGALQLDGVSGYAIAGTVLNPADGPFSVLAWIKGQAQEQVIVSQQNADNWLAIDAEGNLMTELKGVGRSTGPLFSEAVITDGQWHRIGLVWDGSNITLCVDGVVVAEDTRGGLQGSGNGLNIGAGKMTQPGTYFSGLIDDVRIYNRAVSP